MMQFTVQEFTKEEFQKIDARYLSKKGCQI